MFWENLLSLDTYIASINSNIEEFNKYVKLNYHVLKAWAERYDNLIVDLFKSFQWATDRIFFRYIKLKRIFMMMKKTRFKKNDDFDIE